MGERRGARPAERPNALMLAFTTSRIVVEKGGTSWWVPLLVGLLTVAGAAVASYLATWRFKKYDIDGQNAVRTAELVNEAEKTAADAGGYSQVPTDPFARVQRSLQEARIRSQPLGDGDLDDRFKAALSFVTAIQEWAGRQRPGGELRWMREAVANVREGLAPYLSPPSIVPWGWRKPAKSRSFPKLNELQRIERSQDPSSVIEALDAWKDNQPED
jgi:hypothetical protein